MLSLHRTLSYPLEILLSNFHTVCSCQASTQVPLALLQRPRRTVPQPLHRQVWLHQSVGRLENGGDTGEDGLVNCTEAARKDSEDIVVVPDFISSEEEQSLLQDVSRTLRGKKYQYQHWDGVSRLARTNSWNGMEPCSKTQNSERMIYGVGAYGWGCTPCTLIVYHLPDSLVGD